MMWSLLWGPVSNKLSLRWPSSLTCWPECAQTACQCIISYKPPPCQNLTAWEVGWRDALRGRHGARGRLEVKAQSLLRPYKDHPGLEIQQASLSCAPERSAGAGRRQVPSRLHRSLQPYHCHRILQGEKRSWALPALSPAHRQKEALLLWAQN